MLAKITLSGTAYTDMTDSLDKTIYVNPEDGTTIHIQWIKSTTITGEVLC